MHFTADRAVFLDRDGVINRQRADHVTSWTEFEFLPGALGAIRLLTESHARLVVVTNQSAVGRSLMTEEALEDVHSRMCEVITEAGGHIEAVYACLHTPEARCRCRKPQVELFQRAAADLGIDLVGSVMVGDGPSDVEAALAVGCAPIRIAAAPLPAQREGVSVVPDLIAALQVIEQLTASRMQVTC